MSCNNCFNGCMETTSDQCVKYTGLPIIFLDIETGDPLSVIEDKIITYLTTVLDGTGIVPDIDLDLCTLLTPYLPVTPTITLNELLTALANAVCDLQTQLTTVADAVDVINAPYTTDCLTGVDGTSLTHAVLQAVITQLCTTVSDLEDLTADVETNYEKKADLNDDIAAYLAGTTSTKMYNKMVPYSPIPYYGPLANYPEVGDAFVAGVGIGAWEKVYLCNGTNGTPDLRGLAVVGAITDMGGGVLQSNVLGQTYTLGDVIGESTVVLTEATMPSHTHTATAAPHTHTISTYTSVQNGDDTPCYVPNPAATPATITTNATTESITVASKGGSGAHENTSPARVLYYIMYKP